jgi:protease IV
MKNTTLFTIILFVAGLFFATFLSAFDSFYGVALQDGYRSPLHNPAAPAWGGAAGLAFEAAGSFEEGFNKGALFFNGKHFGYIPSWEGDLFLHSFYFSTSFARNLYGGLLVSADFSGGEYMWSGGLLYRPSDMISFGMRGDYPSDENRAPSLTGGVALRPFAVFSDLGIEASVLTFSMDWKFESGAVSEPFLTVHSELIPGLLLSGSWDFAGDNFSAGLTLSFLSAQSGIETAVPQEAPLAFSGRTRIFGRIASVPINRPQAVLEPVLVRYRFNGPVVEVPQLMRAGDFFFGGGMSLQNHVSLLTELAEDPLVSGIVFIDENPALTPSVVRELLPPLLRFRDAGKKVIFYLETAGAADYLLAAASGAEIYLHPAGIVDFKGVSAARTYFGAFLGSWGIDIENYRSHDYKTAWDTLTEEGMRDSEREVLTDLVDKVENAFVNLLVQGRGDRLTGEPQELMGQGPWLIASNALEAGLVDHLLSRGEFEELMSGERNKDMIDIDRLPGQALRQDWSDPRPVTIAVIHLAGSIHTGEGVPGTSIGAETAVRAIRRAAESREVDAIVLRINSGGGSLLASDRISREVEKIVSGENSRPLLVSMGDAAASGGYYIASHADEIFVYPETVTGSIGVVTILPDISGLLSEKRVRVDSVKNHPTADFGAIYRRALPEEHQMLKEKITEGYQLFVDTAARGRGMEVEELELLARGRVWTGSDALENGLADFEGGLDTAVKRAAELAVQSTGKKGPVVYADYTIPDRVIRLPFRRINFENLHGRSAASRILSGFSFIDPALQLFIENRGEDEYLYSISPYRLQM